MWFQRVASAKLMSQAATDFDNIFNSQDSQLVPQLFVYILSQSLNRCLCFDGAGNAARVSTAVAFDNYTLTKAEYLLGICRYT